MEDILPKCLSFSNEGENSLIATAISEALFNCREHAYDEDAKFTKWYLGFGLYPLDDKYQFCVCDKGIGFRESLKKKQFFSAIKDQVTSDSQLIQLAAGGRSGIVNGETIGRGLGLPKATQSLKDVDGTIGIMSGRGWYRAGIENDRVIDEAKPDRETCIQGSIIDFSIPISYIINKSKR
ncbi:MAG: hypothetical protein LKE40_04050 [Spirochaetia bacterium]|jgi:hypothetical protein|nr:hypothetical protein [Spirochaetia bacterium]